MLEKVSLPSLRGLLLSPFKILIYFHLIEIRSALNKFVDYIEMWCSTKIILYSLR